MANKVTIFQQNNFSGGMLRTDRGSQTGIVDGFGFDFMSDPSNAKLEGHLQDATPNITNEDTQNKKLITVANSNDNKVALFFDNFDLFLQSTHNEEVEKNIANSSRSGITLVAASYVFYGEDTDATIMAVDSEDRVYNLTEDEYKTFWQGTETSIHEKSFVNFTGTGKITIKNEDGNVYLFRDNKSLIIEKIGTLDYNTNKTEITNILEKYNLHPENTVDDTDAIFYRYGNSQLVVVDEGTETAYVYSTATTNLIRVIHDFTANDESPAIFFTMPGVLIPSTDRIEAVNFVGDSAYLFTNPVGTISQKSYRYLWNRIGQTWIRKIELPVDFIASETVNTSVYFISNSQDPTLYIINGKQNIPMFSFSRSLKLTNVIFGQDAIVSFGGSLLVHMKQTSLTDTEKGTSRQDQSLLIKIGRIDGQSKVIMSKIGILDDDLLPHTILPIKKKEGNVTTDGYVVVGVKPSPTIGTSFSPPISSFELGKNGMEIQGKKMILVNGFPVHGYSRYSVLTTQKYAPSTVGYDLSVKKIYLGARIHENTEVTIDVINDENTSFLTHLARFDGEKSLGLEHIQNVSSSADEGQFIQFRLTVSGNGAEQFILYSLEAEIEEEPTKNQ